MGVTIKDVARAAGVAHGTVSRYLNGYTVREDRELKIERAINELGYKVNLNARGLKSNKSHTVGVLVRSLVDFFDTSIVTHIEDLLENNDYGVIICDYGCDEARLSSKLRFLIDRAVDGIILFPHFGDLNIYSKLIESKIPVVIIDNDVPGFITDKVFSDNEYAAFAAVERLIKLGHRRIAIISDLTDSNLVAGDRLNGYYKALKQYHIPVTSDYLAISNFTIKSGYDATVKLLKLKNLPTAVFPASYYMAIGAVAAILEFGFRIPEDISVISFDFFERYDIANIPLTCVVQPTEKIGNEAAALLLSRMKNDYSDFPVTRVEKSHMLYRKSEKTVNM